MMLRSYDSRASGGLYHPYSPGVRGKCGEDEKTPNLKSSKVPAAPFF